MINRRLIVDAKVKSKSDRPIAYVWEGQKPSNFDRSDLDCLLDVMLV